MSHLSQERIAEFVGAFVSAGFTARQMMKLAHSPSLLEGLLPLLDGEAQIVDRLVFGDELYEKKPQYLRRVCALEMLTISRTTGRETFDNSGLFPGGVYGSSSRSFPICRKQTLSTKIAIFEISSPGTFAQVFGSLGEMRHKWTEAQIVAFVREHYDKLAGCGGCTFFEMDDVVAHLDWDESSALWVNFRKFTHGHIWTAVQQHRVVVLQ